MPARSPGRLRAALGTTGLPVLLAVVVVLAGLGCLAAALVPVGPDQLGTAGSVAIAAAYTWALSARTGGRSLFYAALAVAVGVAVLVTDEPWLRTGAAVVTCAVAAVLGVMLTVPAVRFVAAARECCYAILVAAVGAVATLGFEPSITLLRFEYVTLVLAFLGCFGVVYRLGAGLHGLGRRGAAAVLIGCGVLALVLAYAELLRRYGTPGLVEQLLDGVRWSRDNLGAFPRPIETLLGVPALAWGCHMRARRRQGWWVCAFGVAATTPVASSLMNPSITVLEAGLSVLYGLVVGLVIGYAVIRIDLAFTGPRGSRARRAEEASALRPEPARTSPLL
ncbi:hypothetical protein [Nocardioides pantholopis]|uniref:hypothetical protein n=1 Tax=Nocardioides pantholopis TaxID=2483798 RepID=UPI000FDC5027|nr:hypothetical protein [Nocardioides pantholopis]